MAGEAIRVRGLVQGVGFRPGVWRLAKACGLAGEVWNDAEGVEIRVWGEPAALRFFKDHLSTAVPLARISSLEVRPHPGPPPGAGFSIAQSRAGEVRTGLVPDAATCAECLAEIRDPSSRRFGYPFTNCTRCGPRLTIAHALPYDRARTTMAVFALCPACRAEYEDPADRRFHAQAIACPRCGPLLDVPLPAIKQALLRGEIVAVKGLGGYQLAVDAGNEAAVARLRARKRRYDKPFALMAELRVVERCSKVSEAEKVLLLDRAAPIVLLERRDDAPVARSVAPGMRTLGFMLPATPLHHLLLDGLDRPLVMTSGNVSEEPQCIDDREAKDRLRAVADVFAAHDRSIANRLDDSVARVLAGEARIIRRARGYAPAPLALPPGFEHAPPLLAMGGELKNTFCLVKDGQAILSQHIGDLGEPRTLRDYKRNLALYQDFYDHRPQAAAVDLHPDYASSRIGHGLGIAVCEVQHHHAHIAACLAENGVPLDAPPVLGIALDGAGYGEDGTLWGGELLLADYRGFRRLAHLPAVALPGGERAAREPWRNAWAQLRFIEGFNDLEIARFLARKSIPDLSYPRSSSCGRLFDAVAAALGVCREQVSYEGQAAMALEALADPREAAAYPFSVEKLEFWPALLQDLRKGVDPGRISARFHNGLADALARKACELSGFDSVALSGGVFQNALLFVRLKRRLEDSGLKVLAHRQVPANDGGLSLGQAAVAAARRLACA